MAAHASAQISTLQGILDRLNMGEAWDATVIDRELEMVGLKERPGSATVVPGSEKISWRDVFKGGSKFEKSKEQRVRDEAEASDQWSKRASAPRSTCSLSLFDAVWNGGKPSAAVTTPSRQHSGYLPSQAPAPSQRGVDTSRFIA